MTLYFIGIGLNDEKDITVKGLETVKNCESIYLEYYTSKLNCPIENLEKLYEKKIIIADRELVEKKADEMLDKAKNQDVAFLVIGDIFSATTHIDLFLRAKEKNIKIELIHNASVLTAVGETGLELYKFGKTTSIPFDNENIKTPIEVFNNNQKSNQHTLFLLDLKPLDDKFMNIKEACEYLTKNNIEQNTLAVGCAGLGNINAQIISGTLEELKSKNFNIYPQCLIIPAKNMHFIEEDTIKLFKQ